jgi:PIN domain nuclease of toxin-antitoxin system
MTASASPLLLDTCAILFIGNGSGVNAISDREIGKAVAERRLYVSPISAWEIGIGVAKGKLILPVDPLEFFHRFVERIGARLSILSPEILIRSSTLPGAIHGDPMDRILVASARVLEMMLVTRDGPILSYGREGHVRTLAC